MRRGVRFRAPGFRGPCFRTIPRLATELEVTTRTIRRDLEALQLAGFPIYDEVVNGTKFWRVDAKAFGALANLQSALDKFEGALSSQMKKFLDRLLEAILSQRIVSMCYHSRADRREKDYIVHPYRLVYVQGGLYLVAFVPAYSELRTFAVEPN